MRTNDAKKQFLEYLSEVAFVEIAAKRAGIARSTIYRWRAKNLKFKREMDLLINRARDGISDRVEAVLVKKALSGEMQAVKVWLDGNRKRYSKPRARMVLDAPEEIRGLKIQIVKTREDREFLEWRKQNEAKKIPKKENTESPL
jgi:hypothetical protein